MKCTTDGGTRRREGTKGAGEGKGLHEDTRGRVTRRREGGIQPMRICSSG